MALYTDTHHHFKGLTKKTVAGAPQNDLKGPEMYGTNYIKYWFDEASGKVFCLVEEAPGAKATSVVHHEAHCFLADARTEEGA